MEQQDYTRLHWIGKVNMEEKILKIKLKSVKSMIKPVEIRFAKKCC